MNQAGKIAEIRTRLVMIEQILGIAPESDQEDRLGDIENRLFDLEQRNPQGDPDAHRKP